MDKQKHLVVGLLAHVDAGKTTLSEALLFHSGVIGSTGRVDKKNAFLDHNQMERDRGITIYSKQAMMKVGDYEITLVDTPGHVDFSAEMERTLQVLDYAILIISGRDGVQAHTYTLWRLLERYGVPVFVFVNKMDQPECDEEQIMEELQTKCSQNCVRFSTYHGEVKEEDLWEQIALCHEDWMEEYLSTGQVAIGHMQDGIFERKIFPCYFGSALKLEGIKELMEGITVYGKEMVYPSEFGGKIYKITRDSQGNRLVHMKVTGGTLKVKDSVLGEKVNQLRVYSGEKFESIPEAAAGRLCALTGLTGGIPGQGVGITENSELPLLEPLLKYRLILPEDCDGKKLYLQLKTMEEEKPELQVVWSDTRQEIELQMMGKIQLEILQEEIFQRFQVRVAFGAGRIVYKETITNTVEGVGHYEPLKHYAEVHLKMEPAERGTGLQFHTEVREEVLDRNWQRLILTHLQEKTHKGVLTGSDITDMHITVVGGRAHNKHTEGGDFRQATYRAVRQGLMQAQCRLLEPVYAFRLEVPMEYIGRAMTDFEQMYGICQPPEVEHQMGILTGTVPVSTVGEYHLEVAAYTGGLGRFICTYDGYAPCHNEEEVIAALGYEPLADVANPSASVFCAHGAGFLVEWDEVENYMHVEKALQDNVFWEQADGTGRGKTAGALNTKQKNQSTSSDFISAEEIDAIMKQTYGEPKNKKTSQKKYKEFQSKEPVYKGSQSAKKEQYLLVDGYNVIYAWEELKTLAELNMDAARDSLLDAMCNYQGYRGIHVMVVFDAYKVRGFQGSIGKYHNIDVVFTKEAETADCYMEKFAHAKSKDYEITVASSDGIIQMIILGQGCRRMSSLELKEELEQMNQKLRRQYLQQDTRLGNHIQQ